MCAHREENDQERQYGQREQIGIVKLDVHRHLLSHENPSQDSEKAQGNSKRQRSRVEYWCARGPERGLTPLEDRAWEGYRKYVRQGCIAQNPPLAVPCLVDCHRDRRRRWRDINGRYWGALFAEHLLTLLLRGRLCLDLTRRVQEN